MAGIMTGRGLTRGTAGRRDASEKGFPGMTSARLTRSPSSVVTLYTSAH